MRKTTVIVAATLLVLGRLAAGPAAVASARDGDVIKTGSCSGSSTWKLDLSPQHRSRIEAQLEVDHGASGDTWRVRIRHDGKVVLRARRTADDSGSFEARVIVPNHRGIDRFVARATDLSTGETCIGRASI